MSQTIKVVLFEYHDEQIEIIRTTLANTNNIELVAVYSEYDALDDSIMQCIKLMPDVVIIDANMDIARVTKQLHNIIPACALIALTIGDPHFEQLFFKNGGRYFIGKPLQLSDIETTVLTAYQSFATIRQELRYKTSETKIKIIIIEDGSFSEDMMLLIENTPDMELIDFYDDHDGFENTVRACIRYNPDVILLDKSTKDIVDYVEKLSQVVPQSVLIGVALSDDPDIMAKAMMLGVREFLPIPPSSDWLNRIRRVYHLGR